MADKITRAKIRELHLSGKTNQEIQDETGATRKRVWNAIDYLKQKTKVVPKVVVHLGLYAERNEQMKKFYASLNRKGALSASHIHDLVSTYKGRAA